MSNISGVPAPQDGLSSTTEPQGVSALRASIPNAVDLNRAYEIVGEMLEYFDGHRLATWAPLASIIIREIERERAACALLARQWRDENKAAAAKARTRENKLDRLGMDHPGMADMLEGAAIECNAIAAAIEARKSEADAQGGAA